MVRNSDNRLTRVGELGLVIWLLSLIIFCSSQPVLAGKDYSIESVIIEAHLMPDGSMDIEERRTYDFRGHFRWATYFLPTEGTGGVVDFSVGEEDQDYSRGYEETEGTYQYEKPSGSIRAKWYFDAEDETRTFTLSYRILDVVKAYRDGAVLYHKFVGTGWDKSSRRVKVTVYPPKPISREEVKAWVHGPLWGKIEISGHGSLTAQVESLPAKTFWEIRAIYPISLFPGIADARPEQVVAKILAEEKIWADEANARREEWIKKQEAKKVRGKYGAWIVLIISGISLWKAFGLYRRHGRKHNVSFPDTLYSELPSDIPPALLSYLLYGRQVSGGALVGTLLDLARKGFLKIKEEMKMKKGIFGASRKRIYTLEFSRGFYSENKEGLQNFEQDLLTFIFDDLSRGSDVIDFKTLEKRRSRFISWFRRWKEAVKLLGDSRGYWEKESLRARNKVTILGSVLIAITIVSIILIGSWAVIPGVAACAVMFLSALIPRRTPEFELEARKWKALKRYLKKYHFRAPDSRFLLESIGRFLVYGVILGLSQQVIKGMAEMIPEGQHLIFVPWYVATHPQADFSPSGFGEALSSLMTAASSTMSSAAGAGGGASGGGGGGTGGSGGGAG
jgi:uncharacterized membrane protein